VGTTSNLVPIPEAAPIPGDLTCVGIDQGEAGGGFPPDTHGAVGPAHIGQVVNSKIRFYTKALSAGPVPPLGCPNAIVLEATLAAFFGYDREPLLDPRLVYDLILNRWIVSAKALPESPTILNHFVAVSSDADPTHGFITYQFDMAPLIGNGISWEYPQIGIDRDSIILTGNKFNANPSYIGSIVIFLPKLTMYNAQPLPVNFCFFSSPLLNVGTIAPTIVLDAPTSPYTTLAAATAGLNFIRVTTWNLTGACPTFRGSSDIPTQTFVPGPAQQPGFPNCATDPADCLDTLDGRFQNAGTQFGSSPNVKLWQVRTHGGRGHARLLTYRVNVDAFTIEEVCSVSASATSFDFNPSIVANGDGTIFLTWSSTDPTNNRNAQVRASGKQAVDACATLSPGLLVFQSTTPLTTNLDPNLGHQRWGDYSAVTLDPSDHTVAYGVNEMVESRGPGWESYIFNMHNP